VRVHRGDVVVDGPNHWSVVPGAHRVVLAHHLLLIGVARCLRLETCSSIVVVVVASLTLSLILATF
jgi:hypothetical protein